MEDFAKDVKHALIDKGWNQSDLARAVGTSNSSISIIIGDRKKSTRSLVEAICKVLNLKVEDYE